MRSFRVQAAINFAKLLGKKGYWKEWLIPYGWQWIRPVGNKFEVRSKIYDVREIGNFRKTILKLGKFNEGWFQRIFEPETKGVRTWEYGMIMKEFKNLKKLKILDVGTGGSLMPEYLASLGAKVTSVDLEKRMESKKSQERGIKFVATDMTKMPFKDNSFDVVMSVSAIEHLDNKKDFWEATEKALKEMKRVTKIGGKIYLTTDAYLENQKTDNWVGSKNNKIEGAFKWEKIKLMAKIIGAEIDADAEEKDLIKNIYRSNFRGRYFTTVFLMGKK